MHKAAIKSRRKKKKIVGCWLNYENKINLTTQSLTRLFAASLRTAVQLSSRLVAVSSSANDDFDSKHTENTQIVNNNVVEPILIQLTLVWLKCVLCSVKFTIFVSFAYVFNASIRKWITIRKWMRSLALFSIRSLRHFKLFESSIRIEMM